MEREVVWAMLDRHAQTVAGFRQVAREAAHHLEVEMLQGCTQIPTQRELRFRRASSAVTEDIDARFDDLLEAAPPQGRDLRPYRSPTRRVSLLAMKFWYPVVAHPAAGQGPWFSHDDDGLVHRAENHPAGPSDAPVYRVVFGLAYDALGDNARPMFQITGSIVSPGEGHPAGRSPDPWYQVRD